MVSASGTLKTSTTMSLHSESNRGADALPRNFSVTAHRMLKEVDEAYIIRSRGHNRRLMPTFAIDELELGMTLGKGGFGVVFEIKSFSLKDENPIEMMNRNSIRNDGLEVPENPQQGKESEEEQLEKEPQKINHQVQIIDKLEDDSSTHVHYEVSKARHMMEKRCIRRGNTRYALKRLQRGTLSQKELARGMVDLALEAKYLSVVWHPNIIKLRGIAVGEVIGDSFFIILDRLEETLDKRILEWAKDEKKIRGGLFGRGRNKKALKELMLARMTYAYDLAAAFMYLHENRLVYRDIKPENIGFDVRGDVKVFDFGLCKSLSQNLKNLNGYGYNLTGRAGSFPYMAPEVVKMESYDSKCDVYSFAMLLWEILSLKQAFKGFTPTKFVNKVVMDKQRLPVSKDWPVLTRLMIPEAWGDSPSKRPDMKRVAILIRGDLNCMTHDEEVLHRTTHMRERSDHSITGSSERGVSV